MDKDTYLVLRVTGPEKEAFDPLSPSGWRSGGGLESTRSAGEAEYRVEAQELDAKDYQEARRDRQVAAMARPMPLRLIEPLTAPGVSAAPAPIHDATWGVLVTRRAQGRHRQGARPETLGHDQGTRRRSQLGRGPGRPRHQHVAGLRIAAPGPRGN